MRAELRERVAEPHLEALKKTAVSVGTIVHDDVVNGVRVIEPHRQPVVTSKPRPHHRCEIVVYRIRRGITDAIQYEWCGAHLSFDTCAWVEAAERRLQRMLSRMDHRSPLGMMGHLYSVVGTPTLAS